MSWLGRFLLIIPSYLAGFIVPQSDPKYYIVCFVIFLVLMILAIVFTIYVYPGRRRN
ncbi:MAG TPA: hypothetical protein VN222_16750 [Novosphingobium sp.]|nr:hypothetical protein [Novosphingobium sp.]